MKVSHSLSKLQRVASTAEFAKVTDCFAKALLHDVEFRLNEQSLELFSSFLADEALTSWGHVTNMLLDCDPDLEEDGLVALLKELELRGVHPKTMAFTANSSVSCTALKMLKRFLRKHGHKLKTVVVPTYYDGDLDGILGAHASLLRRPWTLHDVRDAQQVRRIHEHNDFTFSSTPHSVFDLYHQAVVIEHTGQFHMSARLRRASGVSNLIGHDLQLLTHAMAPADVCRGFLTGSEVRELVLIGQEHCEKPTLGPILSGLRHRSLLTPNLCLSRIDLTVYGGELATAKKRDRPRHLSIESLKHVNLNDCDGISAFLAGLEVHGADLETFVFSCTESEVSEADEDSVVGFVRSLGNLRSLHLRYTPQQTSPLLQARTLARMKSQRDTVHHEIQTQQTKKTITKTLAMSRDTASSQSYDCLARPQSIPFAASHSPNTQGGDSKMRTSF